MSRILSYVKFAKFSHLNTTILIVYRKTLYLHIFSKLSLSILASSESLLIMLLNRRYKTN